MTLIPALLFPRLILTACMLPTWSRELRKNEGTVYATSGDNGQLAVGELVRRVFMDALGFDGIIDKNVNNKFGSRGRGKSDGRNG